MSELFQLFMIIVTLSAYTMATTGTGVVPSFPASMPKPVRVTDAADGDDRAKLPYALSGLLINCGKVNVARDPDFSDVKKMMIVK